ncbi:MAG: tRNA pseudouridine(55) synthase TruB [Gemmatimonadota bacterium]
MDARGGVLLVDKPVGPTSHDVVAKVRRVAGLRRVGHAGTLDPFASGLLILLLGQATRLSEYLLGLDKDYLATARLGVETTTCDPEGEVVAESGGWEGLQAPEVEGALSSLQGRILQKPPVYSSKKIRGEAAHRRVRRGELVEMKEVEVTIHQIGLLELSLPEVRFRVRCSSGTYVRALGRDLGRRLGVGAHLTSLRRTGIGTLSVEDSVSLEAMEDPSVWQEELLSPAAALSHLPAVSIDEAEARRIRQGQEIPRDGEELSEAIPVRILADGDLLAIGLVKGNRLRPKKVLGG